MSHGHRTLGPIGLRRQHWFQGERRTGSGLAVVAGSRTGEAAEKHGHQSGER